VSQNPFPDLQRKQFLNLTTYRKSGQPVVTTVWFAQVGDTLYGLTESGAGKIKRIRHTPRVSVAPSTASGKILGASADGTARVLPPEEAVKAIRALDKKCGLQMAFF
jgi:PPOX class probable F420-dependent enzyme